MQPWVIKHVLFLPSVWVEERLQFSSKLSCRTDRAAPGGAWMTPLQRGAAAVAAPWASCSLPPCDALSLASFAGGADGSPGLPLPVRNASTCSAARAQLAVAVSWCSVSHSCHQQHWCMLVFLMPELDWATTCRLFWK